ncbi:MAG: efflux RND transporter periplasmic adaptor subunit [Lachnospirales bacterium]
MKKYLRFTAAVLCLAMLAGCGGKGPKDGMGEEEAKVTNVEVENPKLNTVKDEYMYSGTIKAADTVDVTAKVQGTVVSTYFEVGDKVNVGDVLYRIDDTDYQNSLRTAEASLNTARQAVASAQTSVDTANGASMQSQLESAKSSITNCETSLENAKKSVSDCEIQITNAQTNYDKAKNDYEMDKQLNAVGGVSDDALNSSRISFEQAENALTTAQNSKAKAELSVKSAEDALSQAKTNYEILSKKMTSENIRKANDGLKSAQAQLQAAQVSVNNAKQQVSYCTVKSPVSGTVMSKNAVVGSMISDAGYQIVDLSSVNVEVKASEQVATSVKVGDAVTINIPSLSSNNQTTGSISEIPPSANSDGTYTIKVNIPNPDGILKGGMFAEVYFAKSTSNNAVVLPRESVLDDNGEEYYVFVSDGNTAKKVVVNVGIDTGKTIEITSGLSINDKVVTSGQTYLADGDQINIVSDNGEEITTEPTTENPDETSDKKESKEAKK